MTTGTFPRNADIQQWHEAAQRAAPIVGAVILAWSAFELTMNEDVIAARLRNAASGRRGAVKMNVPHKFRDRLNEWLRILPSVDRAHEVNAFREEAVRLADIRNNLAHNVQAMWIDKTNELRVFTTCDNKRYDREVEDWRQDGAEKGDEPPTLLTSGTYSGDDIVSAYNDIRAALGYAIQVRNERQQRGLIVEPNALLNHAHRTQGDLKANPEDIPQ